MTRRAALLLLLLGVASCQREAVVSSGSAGGAAAVRELEARLARDPDSPLLRYNLGTVLLGEGRYEDARRHLERAATSTDTTVRPLAHYNAGNADLQPVFDRVVTEGREAALERAIEAYRQTLLLDPSDADAKWNLELAQRLLREPPEQQRPQDDPRSGGGGGGGGGAQPQEGAQDPQPAPASGGGSQPRLSPEAAERLLSSARERELGVQQEKLRKQQPRNPSAH